MTDFVSSAAKGDEKAFEVLVNDTQKMVYNICLNMVKTPETSML